MKRIYIMIILSLFILGAIMFFLYGYDSLKKEKYETAIIVGENTTWIYHKKRWTKGNSTNYDELNWQTYQVFENGKKIGNYSLWHDDKWYVFDANKNAINIEGELLAYSSNHDVEVESFSKDDLEVDQYVKSVLSDKELPEDSEFTKSYKTSIDFDHDGVVEDFYVISNVFPLAFQPEKTFSFVFMVKDNKIYYLYDDVRDYRVYSGCSPEIVSFINTNDDNVDEMIVSCFQYSNLGRIDMLYNFNGENFKILISN